MTPGTKLGPYQILSSLGAGGMGEVYRARDTRLERIIASKLLPSELSWLANAIQLAIRGPYSTGSAAMSGFDSI
jgi:serine/threonine protein kinase